MGPNLFLDSLRELFLSFFSEPLYNTRSLIYISVLWLLLFLFCFLVGIPSIPTYWENEQTQKHRGRAKRRRKGGTLKSSRYHHREEEKKRKLNSRLKTPVGQRHDTICFHQRLHPDPSCEVYNNIAAKLIQLLFSEALEDSLPSVSPLASKAPVTEPSCIHSPAFSADPPGDLIPPPLIEPSPPTPSILSPNPRTALSNFLSASPPGQTLPPEPVLPLETKFSVHHAPLQPKDSFPSKLAQSDFHQEFPALYPTKTSFGGGIAAKLIDPGHLLFLSPDDHDSVQRYSYPKTREDHLKQKLIQLFWGLPSLHCESLSSAVHVLGDSSSIFIFNSISIASPGQESPVLPYFLPPSLLEVQPQPLPQTLPQSQPLPPTQTQPQDHLEPPVLVLPSSSIQHRDCGVQFHGRQNELECLTSSEIQHLEWNVLKKKQKSLWGLPSMVQKSGEDFCPSAPTSPCYQPSKASVAISIDAAEFPLSSELREKFECHLRKKLIHHRWGLPRRIYESVSLMMPPNHCSDICESKSSYGLSWISVYKSQSSPQGSFYEMGSDMFRLEEDEGTSEGHSQRSDPKDLLSDSESSSDKNVGHDSEKDLPMTSLSEENSVVSGQSESQRQLEQVLKVHLSKKFEEISESQLPGTVNGSWHTIEENSSVKSDSEIKLRNLPPSVDGDYCLDTSQELSFLESGVQQMLDTHITKLRVEMLEGLPTKVLEYKEIFKLKDSSSHSSFDSHSSSANLMPEANSKSGGFTPLIGSSKSLHREKVGTENSATVLNMPPSTTSLVGKEGQGTPIQSPSDIKHSLVEEIRRIGDARQTLLPVTDSITGKASQGHFPRDNIHPPELPARQAGAGREPEDKSVNSRDRAEMQLGKNMEEKAEPASMSNVSRETVEAEDLNAAQHTTSDILTTNKSGISQRTNVNETKGTATITTKMPPPKIPDPKSSEFNKQFIDELKSKLEKIKNRQDQGQPTDVFHETSKTKASLPHAQGISSTDMGAAQVLHVHLEDRTVSMEQGQEPWVPKQMLMLCPDKNFPPATKKVSPTSSKSEELGGGDAGLVTSQPGRKRAPAQVALEETVGSKSPQTLPQKRQSPPDSLFMNKMKGFFQWLQPGVRAKKQEKSQVKGSPISAQSRGPVRSKASSIGMTEAQKAMSAIGKFPEGRVGRGHAGDATSPQEPPPSAVKCAATQQKAAGRVRGEPARGHLLNPRAPSCKSCHRAAFFAGQSPASSRNTSNDCRHPQKVGALKDEQLYQTHPQSVPHRATVTRHQSPTCRPHAAQGLPAALTTGGGTVFRDPCPQLRQKVLLQNFQGKNYPRPLSK